MEQTIKRKCNGQCELAKPLSEFGVSHTGKLGKKSICKACCASYAKKYRKNNNEILGVKRRKRYLENIYKERSDNKQWKQSNPDKRAYYDSKRRAAKLQRTPAWANLEAIKQVYADCVEINLAATTAGCTEKFVVDHIIPIQGKLVSGLHISSNLQIITAKENLAKSNKFTLNNNLFL